MITASVEETKDSVNDEDYSYLNYVTDDVPSLSNYEITIEGECLMWGDGVVIPTILRKRILQVLHSVHSGVVKMKALARSYVWWPKMDKEIENEAKAYNLCMENSDNPSRAVLHNWTWPLQPNQRLHADFCGQIDGRMFLVIIDSYSKWVDIKEMRDIKAEATINAFREYFSTWEIPKTIISDNEPTFTSEKFKNFLINNRVNQILTTPYHPASNGAAENTAQ